ncbi:MAG: histidine phosphatase family protein [Cyclobacteriaceae bacterium]
MKTIYLIRHAKSSWKFDGLNDFDRPLNKRGRRDVKIMGKHLRQHAPAPAVIVTSPASRTFYTALHLGDYWSLNEDHILLNHELFHAGQSKILGIIGDLASKHDTVGICCHNPGITNLANHLSTSQVDNIPTCGVVGISFKTTSWKNIEASKSEAIFSFFPKTI